MAELTHHQRTQRMKAALERVVEALGLPRDVANVRSVGPNLAISGSVEIDGHWYTLALTSTE